jgi:ParB family transcriptional regulator, chromosome partitioning protein
MPEAKTVRSELFTASSREENLMATTETYAPNQLYNIPLADLLPDPNQPRKYFDPAALDELTASVARNNVMSPIFFRVEKDCKYIVAGERRCVAATKAGLASVPAIYVETPNYTEISLIENMLRSDLTPVEEAEAINRLMQEHNYQQGDLVKILSKSQPYISETLSLTKLPEAIRDECRKDPAVPKKTLLAIARKKQQRGMLTAYRQYKDHLNSPKATRTGVKATKTEIVVNALAAMRDRLTALDLHALSVEDKDALLGTIKALKELLDKFLEAAALPTPTDASQPAAETSTTPAATPVKQKKPIKKKVLK